MSTFEQNLDHYRKTFKDKLNRTDIDESLLEAIAKSLGASIYNSDSSKVACSDREELQRIKTNFLIGKLGLAESPDLDITIQEVCQAMGSSNRNKYRVVFYYLLVEKFGKEAQYLDADSSATDDTVTDQKIFPTNEDIINKHALYAAGAGLIPIPIVDMVSISAVQYKMIKALAEQYDHIEFGEAKAKSLIAAISGGIGSFELGMIARVFLKGIPFFGPIIGGTAISGFAYTSTKLIGEVFNDHFGSGGDLDVEDLAMSKMKKAFKIDEIRDIIDRVPSFE